MTDTHPLLSVTDLSVAYRRGHGLQAVRGVSFTVDPGEAVALVGESGSGKSTIAQAILGLLPSDAQVRGTIDFEGLDLTRLSRRAWRSVRGSRIAFVPQDPTVSLNPTRRVGAQIAETIRLHGPKADSGDIDSRVVELLDLVGIKDPARRARLYPHELSGGMRQRVLIAAALAHKPQLLVADEPTSALDVTVQKQILDHIARLREELGIAVLLITHDLGVAADRTDRMVVLSRGSSVEQGPTREVVGSPRHEYTTRLLAAVPKIAHGRLRWDEAAGEAVPADDRCQESAGVMLAGHSLRRTFRAGPGAVTTAVDDVDVAVARGHTLGVVGESGSGKSTLARLLTRLAPVESGRVEFDGVDITGLAGGELRRLRARLQFVYQNPRASIDPRFTIGRVLAEPLRASGVRSQKARASRVSGLLELVGLPAEFDRRLPAEVSGGQLQRVAIARALANQPEVVVLDEPVSALDVSVQAQILALLVRLQAQLGLTYVFISHDLAVIRQVSDEVVVMHDGRVVEAGPVAAVFARPRSDYTRSLLAAIPGQVAIPPHQHTEVLHAGS